MNLVIVGCGYVADLYLSSLANHPELKIAGVWDTDPERLQAFSGYHRLRAFGSLDEALAEPSAMMVLNLTSPFSHYEVTRRALEAGRHVYSEKPLAMDFSQAAELVQLAESRGLRLASAPCTILGETAQTLWRAVRNGSIGRIRAAYAELCDGPVALMDTSSWENESGAPWPAHNEFAVGCTIEHAAYYVTWLTALFGPVACVSTTGHSLVPEKAGRIAPDTPDLTVSVLEFASGLVARITCDIYTARDRRIRLFGDEGVLTVDDCWDMGGPVLRSPRTPLRFRTGLLPENRSTSLWPWLRPERLKLVRAPTFRSGGTRAANRIDFFRGPAELAGAVAEGRPCLLSAPWSLHVTEVVLAMSAAGRAGRTFAMESSFAPLTPAPWAG